MTGQLKDWEDVLRAAAEFQGIVSGTTLVGGTASAIYAKHRQSFDADHIVDGLPDRFDELLDQLEQRQDWTTARVNPPKLVLGDFQGVETGLRQLRREKPLETTCLQIGSTTLTLPTAEEMLRIKGWLIVTRNKVRDYLDFVALADYLNDARTLEALEPFDDCYVDVYHMSKGREVSPLSQLVKQLEEPVPSDLDHGLKVAHYKGIVKPWSDWHYITERCKEVGDQIIEHLTEDARENPGNAPG